MTPSERYAERRRNGECVDCQDDAAPGRARCAACAARKVAAVDAGRGRRIDAGLCTMCSASSRTPAVDGGELCAAHRIVARARSLARWRRRRGVEARP